MANTTIQHKRTTTTGLSPNTAQIAVGELALNLVDKKLFTSNGSAVIDLNRARPRRKVIVSAATLSPNFDTEDRFFVTALAVDTTIDVPAGTPEDGSQLLFRLKDNGTARAITWHIIYRASPWLPLPTSTTAGKNMAIGFIYNGPDSKWDLLAVIDGL